MAMIPCLNPGDRLTAVHWNALFTQAETILSNALGGLSALFYQVGVTGAYATPVYADKQWDRAFFFFNPISLPTGLHPMAASYLTQWQTNQQAGQPALFWRQYNHSAITGLVTGLSQLSNTSKWKAVKLQLPTWSAWSTAVYPAGFGGVTTTGMTQTISGTVYAATNCLDACLGVLTATVGGSPYNITFADVTSAEHAQPLVPIDVFVNANLTWDATNWNKYSVIRVHNCAMINITAAFGSVSVTVDAGASRCFRKLSSGWIACGNYFHTMQSGDGRFKSMPDYTGGTASIFMPGIVADVVAAVLANAVTNGTTNFAGQPDGTQFWNVAAIYNNASYSPQPGEKTPPAGGYFPAASLSALVGDLIVPRGNYLAVDYRSPFANIQATVIFDGFANLATRLAAAGLSTRALSENITGIIPGAANLNNLEIYAASNTWDLIDLSTSLLTFLTGGSSPLPATQAGSSQSSSPPSLKLPWLVFAASAVANNPSTQSFNYYSWVTNSAGAPALGSIVSVTLNTAGSTASQSKNLFLPTNALSDIQTWITNTAAAGRVISATGFQVIMTVFGAALIWQEVWPLTAQFNGVGLLYLYNYNGNTRTLNVKLQWNPGTLIVTRAVFLNETKYYNSYGSGNLNPWEHGVWPPVGGSSSRYLAWHFPRIDRQFEDPRWYYHNPSDSPWMPAVTGNYSNSRYPVTPAFQIFNEGLSLNEFNHVENFYEFTPLGIDTPTGPTVNPKTGLSRMGTFGSAADIWSPFAYWLNGVSGLTYPNGAGTTTISTPASSWYDANRGSLLANGTITNPIPNVLPCQVEHYNLLASLLNSQPTMRLQAGNFGGTTFTLNFAVANIIIVNGGTGYVVNDAVGFNLKVSSIGTGGVITGLAQNGSVVVNSYDAYSTPLRPFALSGGSGSGATVDTSSGDGSALTFIPVYGPIGVQIPNDNGVFDGGGHYIGTATLQSCKYYNTDRFFPRNAWYSWNGATAGAADPIGTYLAGLGMTVQNTLPDSYGASIVNQYGQFINSVYSTFAGAATDYCQGFTPAFQVSAQTYRWVTINDARTVYGNFSLPFVLNQQFAPMSFHVVQSTQDAWPIVVPDYILAQFNNPTDTYGVALIFNEGGFISSPPTVGVVAYGSSEYPTVTQYICGIALAGPNIYSPPNGPLPQTLSNTGYNQYQAIPANVITTQFNIKDENPLGPNNSFAITAAEFVNDAAGNWLCQAAGGNISSSNFILDTWNQFATRKIGDVYTDTVTITGSFNITTPTPGSFVSDYTIWTWRQNRHTDRTAFEDDWGILNPVKYGTENFPVSVWTYLREGLPDLLVAALPQNYVYRDAQFVRTLPDVFAALGNTALPYIADNTIEGSQPDLAIIPGAGGMGQYDHTVSTHLPNARLVTIPLDGEIGSSPAAPGAGNNSGNGAGGGDGGGGAGGGSGSGGL